MDDNTTIAIVVGMLMISSMYRAWINKDKSE
jgi:hypothetical protein